MLVRRTRTAPSRAPALGITVAVTLALALTGYGRAAEVRIGEHTFTLPDDFTLELVAGPPLVDRPIVADFDERGRLYVADSSGNTDRAQEQLKKKPHRIVRLVDTDGDGHFDRSTVFADRMMFPEGAMWLDGSLYVAAPPSIWKLTDTDDDGVADHREEWYQGKTLTGCANDLHGPYRGPDGWIYWCKGAFAEQTHERQGRKPLVTRAAHIFRCRPDGSGREQVMTGGMDNPVDVTFTPTGERIFTTTFLQHPGGGKRDGLIHAIYGGVYGKQHGVLDGHPRTGDLMPPLVHLGAAAPCGLTRYRSGAFGESFRHNVFATLFNMHKVTRHELEPSGATFRSQNSDFLVSDNVDFHPTDVVEDADGSLLVINTGGWYRVCCPTSRLWKPDILGGIYRVRRVDAPVIDDPRGGRLDLASMSPASLAALLDDARAVVRDRAATRLVGSGADAVPLLARRIAGVGTAAGQRRAVWTLTRIDTDASRATVRKALDSSSAQVRHAAIHSVSVRRDRLALAALARVVKSSDTAPIRRAAAEALGRLGDPAAVPALLAACAVAADRALEHSLMYALIEIADPAGTRAGLTTSSALTRRAALVALDQMDGGGVDPTVVASLLTSKDPSLRRAAAWIAGRHPDWAEVLADVVDGRIRQTGIGAEQLTELEGLLASFGADPAIQDLITAVLRDEKLGVTVRRVALRAIVDSGLKKAPASWITALAHLLGRGGELLPEVVAAARSLSGSSPAGSELAGALVTIARDDSKPTVLRLEALASIPGQPVLDAILFAFLLDHLDTSTAVMARMAATDVLATARLDEGQIRRLITALEDTGPLEVNRLLRAFDSLGDEVLGRLLLDTLDRSVGRSGLRPDALKTWLEKQPASVQKRGETLLESLVENADEQRRHVEELLRKMQNGDVRRGQKIFYGPKAACSSCHAIGYLGGAAGPDLTKIGTIRTERDLLESIAFPNVTLVRSYEPMLVVTTQGETWNGFVRSETAAEVVLVTGPDKEIRVPRERILDMQPGKVSIMPSGLTQQLTPQQLADLVAFLKSTK